MFNSAVLIGILLATLSSLIPALPVRPGIDAGALVHLDSLTMLDYLIELENRTGLEIPTVRLTPAVVASTRGVAIVPAVIWRLLDEERFLAKHLTGYVDYQNRVRYRLLPPIW